jgi:hypothetical protein
MFGVAGFFGTFIDYLRPTKSPYLVVILIAVGVICFKVGVSSENNPDLRAESLDIPGFFLPIFLIIFSMVPLSLVRKTKVDTEIQQDLKDPTASIANSKYENDLDGVFKFSRALCLAIAAIMLFVYYNKPRSDNWYSTLGYWIIIAQLATFLSYMAFKHYVADDISNIGLFQISFITAVLFAGSTYLATEIHASENTLQYLYYCKTQSVQFIAPEGVDTYNCNDAVPSESGKIKHKTLTYGFDFLQISFVIFAACWVVYEIFWLNVLRQMISVWRNAKKTASVPGPRSAA